MNERPKSTDTEEDIIRMQEEFVKEKMKNPSMQPAAQLIKCQREPEQKQSQFAKKRGHTGEKPKEELKKNDNGFVMGDVVENINFREGMLFGRDIILGGECTAFPKVEKIIISENDNKTTKKSLFALSMEAKKRNAAQSKDTIKPIEILDKVKELPIETSDPNPTVNHLLNDVHNENLERMKTMSDKEILMERQQLLQQLDPKLIEMLKARKNTNRPIGGIPLADIKMDEPAQNFVMPDILREKNSENWLNFDVVEPKKLEWMKHIDENYPKLKPGEQYEARFDWKGFLLPYTEQDEGAAPRDNRELYLHGDDVHRPGYTLQELFRLARSNVLQQRVSALNAISGIICIYNQGYYDGVLEVPISKIFFLLRYSIDENILPVLEAALKGFSLLFYNEVDETLLDVISESHEYSQIPNLKSVGKLNPDLDRQMSDMSLQNQNSFKSNIEEQEMNDISEMNDFHLAETDLYECLLRTNILDRIRYILQTLKPDSPIVLSCFKILIAIARVNERFAEKIACTDDLIYTLIANFIPNIQESPQKDKLYYNRPQILVLKLLRIISSVHLKYAFRLKNYEYIQLLLKSYLFMREDINEELIQLQIETFRLVRAWARYFRCDDFYRSLLPALRFFLEWHYQFLEIEKSNHFLIRQHASALIALLEYCDHCQFMDIFAATFRNCFAKWCTILMEKSTTVKEISQSVLLMSCVQTSRLLLETCEREFNFLEKFLQSKCFDNYCENLSDASILLSTNRDRRNFHQPLPNFGSIVTDKSNNSSPSVIIKQNYQFILLNSLMQLFPFELINSKLDKINKFFEKFICRKVINKNVIINLFNKFEINFILFYLKFININYQNNKLLPSINKNLQLKLSYKILNCLTGRYYAEINYILENFVFSTKFYEIFTAKSEENVLNENFLKNLKINYINLLDTHLCKNYENDTEIALPSYWPYLPLWSLYDRSQNPSTIPTPEPGDDDVVVQEFNEELLINMSLNFLNLLKYELRSNFKSNDYLLLLMLPYFSTELKFLDLDVKFMLNEHKKNLCAELDRLEFNFNAKLLNDKLSFEKFYLAFLEQFQSSSYGDELFSALVMLPLQQKYDIKWRKIVWSEYVAVLRFINCSEAELIGGTLDNYLHPAECDVSLLKCYNLALKSNLLKINSIPYKIAEYHVTKYLSKIKNK